MQLLLSVLKVKRPNVDEIVCENVHSGRVQDVNRIRLKPRFQKLQILNKTHFLTDLKQFL